MHLRIIYYYLNRMYSSDILTSKVINWRPCLTCVYSRTATIPCSLCFLVIYFLFCIYVKLLFPCPPFDMISKLFLVFLFLVLVCTPDDDGANAFWSRRRRRRRTTYIVGEFYWFFIFIFNTRRRTNRLGGQIVLRRTSLLLWKRDEHNLTEKKKYSLIFF